MEFVILCSNRWLKNRGDRATNTRMRSTFLAVFPLEPRHAVTDERLFAVFTSSAILAPVVAAKVSIWGMAKQKMLCNLSRSNGRSEGSQCFQSSHFLTVRCRCSVCFQRMQGQRYTIGKEGGEIGSIRKAVNEGSVSSRYLVGEWSQSRRSVVGRQSVRCRWAVGNSQHVVGKQSVCFQRVVGTS